MGCGMQKMVLFLQYPEGLESATTVFMAASGFLGDKVMLRNQVKQQGRMVIGSTVGMEF